MKKNTKGGENVSEEKRSIKKKSRRELVLYQGIPLLKIHKRKAC